MVQFWLKISIKTNKRSNQTSQRIKTKCDLRRAECYVRKGNYNSDSQKALTEKEDLLILNVILRQWAYQWKK